MTHHQFVQLDEQASSVQRVLLTGATGFIGGAVARALVDQPSIELSMLVRGPLEIAAMRQRFGDLTNADSLLGCCDGIDMVVHTASYVGADPKQCNAVNNGGTAALLREAIRSGVQRVIYISTAAVSGLGPHSNVEPEDIIPVPLSPASQTRLVAEERVRDAGGIVLRPHLIYGVGDRWFIPAIVKLIRLLSGLPNIDQVKLSTVSVDDLANALVGLVTHADVLPPGIVLHANHPVPTVLRIMIDTIVRNIGLAWTNQDITREQAYQEIRARGGSERHLARICTDHWYTSHRIWDLAGQDAGAGFAETFPRYTSWYRTELAKQENALL
jgi:nucleoside-diphosphate-sugar epimerase